MNAAHDELLPKVIGDQKETLKALDEACSSLRSKSDLAGLIRVKAEAETMGKAASGRVQRKAGRVAQKAQTAIEALKREGIETSEEREARELDEERAGRWRSQQLKKKLLERTVSLLQLLLNNGSPPGEGVAVFRPFVVNDGEGDMRIEIAEAFESWFPLLTEGYERSCHMFAEVDTDTLQGERLEIVRILKSVAVELMTAGAEVRGLTTDAVPLVAYSLYNGTLPLSPEAASADAAEKVNDLLLSTADEVSAMHGNARPLFFGLYRLAVLIGEAQAYADHLSLGALSLPNVVVRYAG